MAEDEKTPTTPAPEPQDPPSDPGKSGAKPATKADTKEDSGDDWLDKLDPGHAKYVRALKAEIANKRQKASAAEEELAELKSKIQAQEDEKLKEQGQFEKLYKEQSAKTTSLEERLMRAELKLIAQREGINDPSDIELMPLEGLKLDAKGQVVGAEKVVLSMKESKPHWFKSADPAQTTPPATPATPDPKSSSSARPAPAPGTAPPILDVMKMTKADAAKAEEAFLAGVRKK